MWRVSMAVSMCSLLLDEYSVSQSLHLDFQVEGQRVNAHVSSRQPPNASERALPGFDNPIFSYWLRLPIACGQTVHGSPMGLRVA